MNKSIRIISAILASVMMLLTLCSCKDTSYACTVDGVEYPVGPYAFYAYYTRDKYQAQLAQYGMTDFASSLLSEADSEGTKLYEYINKEVQSSYISHLIVNLKFDDLGLTLSDEQKTAIDEAIQTNWIYQYTD